MRVRRHIFVIAAVVLGLAILVAFAAPARAAYAPGERIWVKFTSTGPRADVFNELAGGLNGSVFAAGIGRGTEESSRLLVARYSAEGARLWYHTYAGPATGGLAEEAAVSDGGSLYVACTQGTWVLPRSQDIVVVKYAKDGSRVWTRVFDGPAHRQDYAADIAAGRNGTVYVAGTARRSGTGKDIVLIKLAPDGHTIWTRYYAGPGSADTAQAVAVSALTGNAYVVGSSDGDGDAHAAAVIKVSRGGHVLWSQRLHGGAGPAGAADVAVADTALSPSVYVSGWATGGMSTGVGMLCAKLGSYKGAVKWQVTAEEADSDEYGREMALDLSGNVIVAGETVAKSTAVSRGLVAKWDADGTPVYQHTYQVGLPTDNAAFTALAVDAAGNAFCGGYTSGSTHAEDYTVAAFRPDGGDLWGNVFTSTGVDGDYCRDVLVRKGGIYGAGSVTPGDDPPLPGNMNQNALLIKHQR